MNVGQIAAGFKNVEEFFGCPLDKVHTDIARFVLGVKKSEWPMWLHGKSQPEDLPRWTAWTPVADVATEFPLPVIKPAERRERIRWIVEFLGGPWGINSRGFFFVDEDDAFAYRLRWTA